MAKINIVDQLQLVLDLVLGRLICSFENGHEGALAWLHTSNKEEPFNGLMPIELLRDTETKKLFDQYINSKFFIKGASEGNNP